MFSILLERAAKFADRHERRLEVYFEESGKKEDRRLIRYLRELKQSGNPFNASVSEGYQPLTKEDYRRIILGEPKRLTKQSPHVQVADLVLYPLAKSGYDSDYYPYRVLKKNGKLIDCKIPEDEISTRGIKYSCFSMKKK
ncbi:MAG: hypothetical protein OXI91_03380 [Chloroflexota bacterium]|nr:hypothetical protein [Chloroflexota bacterium]